MPVVAQDGEQSGGEHDVAVLAAFSLVDANDLAPAVDVGRAQADCLRHPHAGRVAGGQDGTVLESGRTVEEAEDFLGTGDDGQLAGLLGRWDGLLDVPTSLEGDLVEEAQGGDCDPDRAGRHLPVVGEEQLIVADLLRSQQGRGLAEVAGEQRYLTEIGGLRARGKMAHLHVLGHTETEWCHGKAPLRDDMGCMQPSHALATGASQLAGNRGLIGTKKSS